MKILVGASLLFVTASCGTESVIDVKVANAWAQPVSADRRSAAVYMTILPTCSKSMNLMSVETSAPQKASLHSSSAKDGVLKMKSLQSIPLSCGEPTSLKPMGDHIMVTGIRAPIGIGDHIRVVLHLDRAKAVTVDAEVTTLAVLDDVDPMHMHSHRPEAGGMSMDHMKM